MPCAQWRTPSAPGSWPGTLPPRPAHSHPGHVSVSHGKFTWLIQAQSCKGQPCDRSLVVWELACYYLQHVSDTASLKSESATVVQTLDLLYTSAQTHTAAGCLCIQKLLAATGSCTNMSVIALSNPSK